MPDNKKQGRSNKTMTFFVCFLAALAGLLFGLDIGVIAGALPFIANEFQISAHTQEWVFRTVNGAYEKIRRELTEKGIF